MKVIFQEMERAITNCPKRKRRANKKQCQKCDEGAECGNSIHCLFNNPVGVCISSIGHALEKHEVYAVILNKEFSPYGTHICWSVADGVIGEPVYASKSRGYYCKPKTQMMRSEQP